MVTLVVMLLPVTNEVYTNLKLTQIADAWIYNSVIKSAKM